MHQTSRVGLRVEFYPPDLSEHRELRSNWPPSFAEGLVRFLKYVVDADHLVLLLNWLSSHLAW